MKIFVGNSMVVLHIISLCNTFYFEIFHERNKLDSIKIKYKLDKFDIFQELPGHHLLPTQ